MSSNAKTAPTSLENNGEVPVPNGAAASNRIGSEQGDSCNMRFYGSSFITDHQRAIVVEASEDERQVLVSEIDLGEARRYRDLWNVFRDRRPDLYGPLMTLDGVSNHRN
jgi:N-carbamoylputrescine amidase